MLSERLFQTEGISEFSRFKVVGSFALLDLKYLPDGRSLNKICPG